MKPIQPRRRKSSPNGSAAAVAGGLAVGVSELSQLALYMAASLAGLVTAALAARAPFFRALMRRLGYAWDRGPRGRRPTREQSLPLLAEAIVGSDKRTVAAVFGPPRGAVLAGAGAGAGAGPGGAFWRADTWYYPLPHSGPLAMAIEFGEDHARHVDFIRVPQGV